jgi:hypothetical protein
MKLKLKTTKYYKVPPVCTAFWTEKDWEKMAFFRTESKKIFSLGYVYRTLGKRNKKGELLYVRAEKDDQERS